MGHDFAVCDICSLDVNYSCRLYGYDLGLYVFGYSLILHSVVKICVVYLHLFHLQLQADWPLVELVLLIQAAGQHL